MAFLRGLATSFILGQFDLSTFLNSSDVDQTLAALETTTYQAPGASKTYIPGLKDGKITAGGLFDGSATGINAQLQPILAAGTIAPLTWTLTGVSTQGNPAYIANVEVTDYKVSSPVGGVVSVSASFQPTGVLALGAILSPLAARVAAGNDAGSIDNGASSANGGVANVHLTAFTSGSVTPKVQHSTDNSTWADLITFTALAALGSQTAAVAGTVNRYTRGAWTGTFNATFAIAFARQ